MKEIGAIFVVSIKEIRTVQLAAIKRRYKDKQFCLLHFNSFRIFCELYRFSDSFQTKGLLKKSNNNNKQTGALRAWNLTLLKINKTKNKNNRWRRPVARSPMVPSPIIEVPFIKVFHVSWQKF